MLVIPKMASTPAKALEKIKDLDLYLLLEVASDADVKVIKKAYRKKALSCHPDKNPDKPEIVALFHQLSAALEVLSDESARKAYDNVLKARKANEIRNRELDGKRRKLKDDLEARERQARDDAEEFVVKKQSDWEKLQAEIERLRKEGSKQLEEEQEAVRKQLEDEIRSKRSDIVVEDTAARVKVRWQKEKDEVAEQGYTKETLETIFTKYGTVTAVVVNSKKRSALVEFEDKAAAKMAANIETGYRDNPLKVKPLFEQNPSSREDVKASGRNDTYEFPSFGSFTNAAAKEASEAAEVKPSLQSTTDFESLVFRKLRQEEERKRLIAKMMEEDDKANS